MAGASGYAAIAGALLGAGGAFLGGRANDIARNRLEDAADIPGLDLGWATDEALGLQEKNLDRGIALGGRVSAANQAQLNAREESALPGIGDARSKALGRIKGLFEDDASWLQGVQRRGAALGLSSGLMGSQAGQLQTLRLSDQEQMARTSLGTGLLGSLIGSMRIAQTPGVQTFMGPSIEQTLNLRSQERRDRQQLRAKAAGIPGQTAAWGQYLTQQGAMLEGAGLQGVAGGGMFGGSTTPSGTGITLDNYGQQGNMMADYYGSSNMGASYGGAYRTGFNDYASEL